MTRTGLAFELDRADACDRAEQLHERGEVVRADVEQRAGALLEQEVGVRMPRLGPGVLQQR